MAAPTMIISCPHCHSRQSAPVPVADGTDPWPCEQCGRTIELPRRDLTVPASKDEKRKEPGK
jgi:DNA-directed RNA polymerase subunit RPC12/RpoP